MPFLSKLTKRLAQSWYAAAAVAALAAAGCSRDQAAPTAATAPEDAAILARRPGSNTTASLSISPSSASGAVGQSAQFTATAYNASGSALSGKTFTWRSTNTAVVSVTSSGYATAISPGSAAIVASVDNVSAQVPVTVSGGTTVTAPGAVTNLSVQGATDTSLTITFTQVSNGAGGAASYDVRAAVAPIAWGSASSVSRGTCATPRAGTTAGSAMTCTIMGLTASTNYQVELIAFRGTLNVDAVFGALSNIASGATTAKTVVNPTVARVVVSPSTASGNVGDAAQFTATAYDANGAAVSGQTATWASSNTAVATVSSSGMVNAVGAGTAQVNATIAGVTGSASVTVNGTTGSGTTGGGSGIFFTENFDDAGLGGRGWYDNTGLTIDPSQHAGASGSSAQFHFTPGATTPTSGGAIRHKFPASNSMYVAYDVKYSSNWVGSGHSYHPHEFYALSSWDGDWDGMSNNWLTLYFESNYQNGGVPRVQLQDNKAVNSSMGGVPNNLIGVTEDRSVASCNSAIESGFTGECWNSGYWYSAKKIDGPVVFQPAPGAGYKNNWNHVEVYVQLNSVVGGVGLANGVIQYWFNGTLVIDRHDVMFRTATRATLQLSQFLIAPYIGDGSPVDQSMWVDNLTVAAARAP